jgi:murein DD-endopeptidase MepM/ murein hydrolase activator NlpD
VPEPARRPLLETAGAQLDLRRLSPRTGLLAVTSARGTLRSLSIRTETDRYVRIRLHEDDEGVRCEPEWIELPLVVDERVESGVVESSVAQALAESPHGTTLTAAFADVLQWDVDLLVEPRPGDRVRIVYETRSLGQLPGDLPPFGSVTERPGEELAPGKILAASYAGRIASASAFWVEDDDGDGGYYDAEGNPLRKTFLKSPLNYRRISSGFTHARRHPITRKVVPHHGVDFAAAPGTPVVATADGRVASAGWDGALGRAVRIRHGSEYVTIYGHLRGFARGIRAGVEVEQNQVIGYVGSSGRATGPHLHYTMVRSGRAINPLRFENPPSEPLPLRLRPRLALARQKWGPILDQPDDGVEIAAETATRPGA